MHVTCVGSESFVRGGGVHSSLFFFFFFFFFLVDEGSERIQIALKAGPHQPASETPFKLRFAGMPIDGPTLNADM